MNNIVNVYIGLIIEESPESIVNCPTILWWGGLCRRKTWTAMPAVA